MLNLATIEDLKDMPTKGYVDAADSLIPFAQVDATSTATAFTATVAGITELRDGVIVLLKNGVVTSASGFTLNINNLGAKPVYSNMAAATREKTIFNVNYTLLFVYDSTRVEGGCWVNYRGYYSDSDSIGYQLRTNSTVLKTADQSRYYRLFFTSADGTHWVPANTAKDNSATSTKTVNQRKIDPHGRIIYYSMTTNLSAESDVPAAYCWDQYVFALGYSFNRTGEALTLTTKTPVYIKCAPQADGSAIIDSTTPFVQTLPSTEDGKIYIFLGIAYSATNVELVPHHPVYHYSDGAIRLWTNDTDKVDKESLNYAGIHNRTYVTEIEETSVLTESTDLHPSYYAVIADERGDNLVRGKMYRITFDGAEYYVPALRWFWNGSDGSTFWSKGVTFIGDLSLFCDASGFYGTLPDVPFVITNIYSLIPLVNEKIFLFAETAGTHTVKIERIDYDMTLVPNSLVWGGEISPIYEKVHDTGNYTGICVGLNDMKNRKSTVAIGFNNTMSGQAGAIFGNDCSVTGQAGVAVGNRNEASAAGASAFGYFTKASGNFAESHGYDSTSSGSVSTTHGFRTIANHKSQFAFGEYNEADDSSANASSRGKYIEIVGNGADAQNRSNARTLDWQGNEVLAGKLTVGANPTNSMDVVTKSYFDATVPNAASIDGSGLITFKHDNTALFTLQLPLYYGE